MGEGCIQFDYTKHRMFSPGTTVPSCSSTVSIRDDPYWTSRENSLKLIELSSINIQYTTTLFHSCDNIVKYT